MFGLDQLASKFNWFYIIIFNITLYKLFIIRCS
jgi:hypothetical protein